MTKKLLTSQLKWTIDQRKLRNKVFFSFSLILIGLHLSVFEIDAERNDWVQYRIMGKEIRNEMLDLLPVTIRYCNRFGQKPTGSNYFQWWNRTLAVPLARYTSGKVRTVAKTGATLFAHTNTAFVVYVSSTGSIEPYLCLWSTPHPRGIVCLVCVCVCVCKSRTISSMNKIIITYVRRWMKKPKRLLKGGECVPCTVLRCAVYVFIYLFYIVSHLHEKLKRTARRTANEHQHWQTRKSCCSIASTSKTLVRLCCDRRQHMLWPNHSRYYTAPTSK